MGLDSYRDATERATSGLMAAIDATPAGTGGERVMAKQAQGPEVEPRDAADVTADGGGDEGVPTPAPAPSEEPEEPRFAQDDLNKLVGKTRKEEREKARRALLEELGVSDPADVKKALAEYNELKKAQMTAEERIQAELEEA